MKHLERFHICATWRMSGKRPEWNEDGSWTHCANGDELKRVEVFKYLGRLISYDDANSQAIWSNLRKAHGCWSRVYCMLWAENARPKTCRIFYKATVQALLLYGSETWGLSPSSMKCLEEGSTFVPHGDVSHLEMYCIYVLLARPA